MSGSRTREQSGQTMSLANAVAHLKAISAGVSLEPADYNWGTPSMMQQQALYTQFLQLAFVCSLPHLQYLSYPTFQPGRGAMFPGFMPPFPGFLSPITAPCPAQAPSPPPCSASAPGQQVVNVSSGQPENDAKSGKAGSPSKKSGSGSKAKASKGAFHANNASSAAAVGMGKDDPEIELEDICRLLGDDAFLEHLQDDVLSEGSNGSSSTSEGRVLSKNNSNDRLSGSLNNHDGGFLPANNFASAFDLDMDDLPVLPPASSAGKAAPTPAAAQTPSKASSGDLNNMVASSPTKSTRSSRSAAREAATASKEAGGSAAGGPSAAVTKITLKTNKGGVQKTSGTRAAKAQAAAAAAVAEAAAAAVPGAAVAPKAATAGTAPVQPPALAVDCSLTAADLSRLLGEDDNRIPDGWDLDLDFENPFSCSITAF